MNNTYLNLQNKPVSYDNGVKTYPNAPADSNKFGRYDYLNELNTGFLSTNLAGLNKFAKSILLFFLNQTPGHIHIKDEQNHKTYDLGRRDEGLINVTVYDESVWGLTLLHNSTGLGVGYAHGLFECDDLTGFLQMITKVLKSKTRLLNSIRTKTSAIGNKVRQLFYTEDKNLDRDQIHFHYDVSNDFFELMLDETMSYSCGVFSKDGEPLTTASETKIQKLIELLEIKSSDHLLEIGSGWGGLAIRAAQLTGCKVTTSTISKQQEIYVNDKVKQLHLQNQIKVLDNDFRDIHGQYDKLVSVEMIEALDWNEHPKFMKTCSNLLKPGGKMALQAIVHSDQNYERAKTRKDFIKRVVFPGGCLPSVNSILSATSKYTDLSLRRLEDIGKHYSETLKTWKDNLHINGDSELSRLRDSNKIPSDPSFIRYWDFYLSYCRAGFLEKFVSDVQMLFEKPSFT